MMSAQMPEQGGSQLHGYIDTIELCFHHRLGCRAVVIFGRWRCYSLLRGTVFGHDIYISG